MSSNKRFRRTDGPTLSPTHRLRHHNSPIGTKPVLAPGQTQAEYNKLLKTWHDVLAETGFNDIERFEYKTGRALPAFKPAGQTISAHADIAGDSVQPHKVEYFRLCRAFAAHADWRALFGRSYYVYKTVFNMHVDGYTFRDIAKHFRGDKVPKHHKRPKASMFWSHWTLGRVLRIMWKWQRTHPEGLLLPEETTD